MLSIDGAWLRINNFTDHLVHEAMRITDNLEEGESEVYDNNANARRSKWRGKGRVMYYDDTFQSQKPVVGLTIKLHKWFRTRTGKTDSRSYYRMEGARFRGKAHYSYKWEMSIFTSCRLQYINGDDKLCDLKMNDIENYERD